MSIRSKYSDEILDSQSRQAEVKSWIFYSYLYDSEQVTLSSESDSRSVVSDSLRPHGMYSSWNSPGQNTGVGSLSLLQGIFLTQGLSPGLLHCRQILYQLSHPGSPRILEWAAWFSGDPENQGLLHFRWIIYQLNYDCLIKWDKCISSSIKWEF